MFTVALTGGISSGKSTVAHYFSELGVTVIDADQIARRLTRHDPDLLAKIVKYFGSTVLTQHKQLDRVALRTLIFSDTKHRDWLEQLLHPLIYKEIQCCIQAATGLYCLVVIPLLFEERTTTLLTEKPLSTDYIELNRILLVTTSKTLQIQRTQVRDQLEKKQIEAILSAQIASKVSVNKADDIIYNQSTLESLSQSVAELHVKYLSFLQPQTNSLEESPLLRYYLVPK